MPVTAMPVPRERRPRRPEAEAGSRFLATNRYHDHQFKMDVVKIMPGEFYVASGQIALATVLGSCVSAVIWDPVTRIGGMNHFMLAAGHHRISPDYDSARFGLYAMDTLIEHVLAAGALRHTLEARLFGGARVLRGFTHSDIGDDNARFALDYLEAAGIPVIAQSLGDVYPRKLYFFPDSGQVLMRKLKSEDAPQVVRDEQEFRFRMAREA